MKYLITQKNISAYLTHSVSGFYPHRESLIEILPGIVSTTNPIGAPAFGWPVLSFAGSRFRVINLYVGGHFIPKRA